MGTAGTELGSATAFPSCKGISPVQGLKVSISFPVFSQGCSQHSALERRTAVSSKSVAVLRVRLSQQCPCKANAASSSGLSPQGYQVTGSGVCVCSAATFHSPKHPVCMREDINPVSTSTFSCSWSFQRVTSPRNPWMQGWDQLMCPELPVSNPWAMGMGRGRAG